VRGGANVVPLKDDPHVIIDEKTGQPFKGDWYRSLFARVRAIAAAGVPGVLEPCPERAHVADSDPVKGIVDLRDQDLRDTTVTWMARSQADVYEIARVTGHSFATIHDILKHNLALHPEMADAAIGKLVKFMQERGMVL
jgi:hypothetical protein